MPNGPPTPNGPTTPSNLRRATAGLLITPRSIAAAVALLGLGLVVLAVLGSSTRVLGWLVASAVLASLLSPAVTRLGRHMPRLLAFVIVLLGLVGMVGGVVYALVDDVRAQADRLRREAPAAARRIERSDRWGEAARAFKLEERTREFVRELPLTLQGGDQAEALRATASRSVAFLAAGVLTIFLMIHGRRLFHGGLRQIRDPVRRGRIEETVIGAHRRALLHLSFRLAVFAAVGLSTHRMMVAADVPGPVVLALFVAAWSLVPTVGIAIGTLLVTILVAALTSAVAAILVAAGLLALQAAEIALDRRLVHPAVHVGPFLSLFALMVGLEVYGVGGALVSIALVTWVAALMVQMAPTDEDVIEAADLGVEGIGTGAVGGAA
jgi:predicted PurR-regulated permease PerM